MSAGKHIPLNFKRLTPADMLERARTFYSLVARRRSVRAFAETPVDREIIEQCLHSAGSAPSGANRQPWHFAVVSSAAIKADIRDKAEQEEREFYQRRATKSWLDDLAPLGTDASKPFLETAPYLIVVFAQKWEVNDDGTKHKNYYVPESVGIACGLLLTALHNAGLATLTHTPSPMRFLNEILQRPSNESPAMIIVTGLPADDATVPDIQRKPLQDISSFH